MERGEIFERKCIDDQGLSAVRQNRKEKQSGSGKFGYDVNRFENLFSGADGNVGLYNEAFGRAVYHHNTLS